VKLSHGRSRFTAAFDDNSVVALAGLVPMVELARKVGLADLADQHVRVQGPGSAAAGAKAMTIVAGMVAGADCIDDLDVLRHGAMPRLFTGVRAPSTIGTHLRAMSMGNVSQVRVVARQVLVGLAAASPVLPGIGQRAVIDIDDTDVTVFGTFKQAARYNRKKAKAINVQAAVLSTDGGAPLIAATSLRKGAAASARGAAAMLKEAIATAKNCGASGQLLVRADAGYYAEDIAAAVIRAGALFSIGARQNPHVKAAIASIGDDAWVRIEYSQAIPDPETGQLISAAEIAEIPYTAFARRDQPITARLIVRRVPELDQRKNMDPLFPAWRYHAIFTNNPDPLIIAEATHRRHAIVEQVFADLKNSALAHLPSGDWRANAAWVTYAGIAFNLTRAFGATASPTHGKATTATLRRHLINIPARITRSARRLHLHLPDHWPWRQPFITSWTAIIVPRQVVGRFCLVSNVGMVGSARPMCTSSGRFQAIASCGRTVLYSMR
jgi:hypothetical protein